MSVEKEMKFQIEHMLQFVELYNRIYPRYDIKYSTTIEYTDYYFKEENEEWFRIRKTPDDKMILTRKSAPRMVDGYMVREEHEEEIPQASFAEIGLSPFQCLTLECERQVFIIGSDLAEMTLDRVFLPESNIHRYFVEIELKRDIEIQLNMDNISHMICSRSKKDIFLELQEAEDAKFWKEQEEWQQQEWKEQTNADF